MPVNFDLNDIYAFRALMEYGSFRLAAESICLSQSALSRRIEKLETALGARLFDRTTRRVALTLYGQSFAERSEQLLANVEAVLADIQQASQERTGLVTVATVPSGAYYFMPDIIRQFQARYPRVRIKLIDSSVGNVIDAVSSGQADFGICFGRNLPPHIEFVPLVEDVYVAACRRDHPLAKKTQLTWKAYFERIISVWIKSPGTVPCSIRRWGTLRPRVQVFVKPAMSQRCLAWWKPALASPRYQQCQCLWRGTPFWCRCGLSIRSSHAAWG